MDKVRIKKLLGVLWDHCQDEFSKTTVIGKKMVSASKVNAAMREAYEQLGKEIYLAISEKRIKVEGEEFQKLCDEIKGCSEKLEELEKEMSKVKEGKSDQ